MVTILAPQVDAVRDALGAQDIGDAPGFARIFPVAFARRDHDEALAQLREREGRSFDAVLLLEPTSPLRASTDLAGVADLLARRWVPYAYVYPFAEFAAGALMAARVLDWLSIPLALFIGTVGAVSVFYAVYVQRRELKCACVGGSGKVPLGFVSLSENLFMVAMALWMLAVPHA